MSKELPICPVCGEGHLSAHSEMVSVEYHGKTGEVLNHFCVCDVCETEQAGANEMRMNKRAMIAFKKRVDGLLSGEEIRRMREAWGIDQKHAALIFGGGPVAFSKYENNDVMQSEGMDKLLRAAWYAPDVFAWLKELAGLDGVDSNHRYHKTTNLMNKVGSGIKLVHSFRLDDSANYHRVESVA